MNKEEFIFDKAPQLLLSLDANENAKWGKMSPQHMIEHLGVVFMISAEKIEPPGLPENRQKELYNKLTSGSFSFQPNTSSPVLPEAPLPLRFDNIEEAKAAALKAINAFKDKFEKEPDAKIEHPVFGRLSYKEWLLFHELHLKHHLKQFGLLEE